jgi:uncharacterized membrane protein YgdD (TMEM256/DUF423 family)
MLQLHAVALLAAAALLNAGMIWRPLGLRAFAGHRLFPMAAPTGGTMAIASWVALAIAGLVRLIRGI